MTSPEMSPRKELARMLVGNQIQQAIYVAARLGIADLLKDGPHRSEELAQATGADPVSLYRVLRALASFGIFAEDEQGRFESTPLAALLQAGTPGSMRAFALWSGGVSYQAFGGLEYSVLTGKPAFEHHFGMEFYEYLARNPEVGTLFDELMAWNTGPVAQVVAAYDFSGVKTIVDVGGGRGVLLAAVLNANPGMWGLLVDEARVLQGAKSVLEAEGVDDRCMTVCADIYEEVPYGGDAYILKSVVHGVDDRKATRLLRNCREAMNDGGKLLLIEFIMPPGNYQFPGKLMDLLMLVGSHGGRERSEEEFRSLYAAAGFQLTNIMPTKYGYSVIEGVAA
jgi:hypothetical protein